MSHFSFKLQVFFEDIDSFGMVHHANFIKFMERARIAWLLQLGFRVDDLFAQKIFFVIKKIEIDYFKPARLYDELEIVSRIIERRPVAMCYEQVIRCPKDSNVKYCEAVINVVCVNDKLRPRAMPQELLEKM